jgi:hypothetical protein
MKTGAFRAKRWISLGLLLVMILSFAAPTFALPYRWYSKIYVHKKPSKLTYTVGEYMDLAGLELWGDIYDSSGAYVDTNKTMKDALPGYFDYSPHQFTKPGKQKVTFKSWCVAKSGGREWLTTSINVTVKEAEGDSPTAYFTDIFVAAQPKKTVYKVGESFKTSGLSISGHEYREEDGKKHTVTKLSQKNMKISPSKFTKPGKQDVKLSLKLLAKSGDQKWFSTKVQVYVEQGELTITKHPYGETVMEGGSCAFTSRADNAENIHWFFTKDSQVVDSIDAPAYFPGLTVSGTTHEKLKLSHIPASLNGWSVFAVFYGNDSSITSNNAGIVVLSNLATNTPVPYTAPPVVITPKPIITTPQPSVVQVPTVSPTPVAPATTPPASAPKAAETEAYAEGIHCSINGQNRVLIQGDTLIQCEAEEIDGFVFDHWEINGEPDYSFGSTATFIASDACVIRAYYHERKILRTVNCYFQLLTQKNNAQGAKYEFFDFEEAYYSPVTKSYCPAGTLSCYVTAVIPRKAEIDYWLINGVRYQFPDNSINKFRILDLNEATTIEPVFKGSTPTNLYARPAAAQELEKKVKPMFMHCINCWGQFMNSAGTALGEEYREFNFDQIYTNPVTRRKLPGGLLDIFISTKVPHGCMVDTWIINDVMFQFPTQVLKFRVLDLNEDTTYEVRFRGKPSGTRTPGTMYPRDPGDSWWWNY